MPTKLILAAALTAALVHDYKSHKEKKEMVSVFADAHTHFVNTEAAHVLQIKYLCHLLNEHDIPADEFDLIALHYHKS